VIVVFVYLLGRLRHRWEVNIKMILTEKRFKIVDWIHLAEDMFQWWALVNAIVNFLIP
jgi:hypothetical protein